MSGHLGDEQRRRDRVLVAHEIAGHIAIALFKGEDILIAVRLFPGGDTLGHELEAGKGVLKVDAVLFGDDAGHRGGNDARQRAGVLRQRAGLAAGVDDIVQQQHAHLVARDGHILVAAAHHRADAVRVGVGADDQVAADLLGEVDGQIKALGVFGVGADDGREAAVDDHLLLHRVEVFDAESAQRLRHELVAAAVERRVHDAEIICDLGDGLLVNGHLHDLGKEGLVGLLAHDLDASVGDGFVEIAGLKAREDVDPLHLARDGVGVLGRQLGAVGPVDLIAVVFLGVMAGRHVDAGGAAVVDHGEAQLRRGTQRIEQTDVDAVGRHDAGRLHREITAVETAVVVDGDALGHRLLALGADDVGEGLGGVADDMDIHMMKADLHRAAQTGRAELERGKEAAFDLFLVVSDVVQFFPFLFGEGRAVQPALVLFFIIPHRRLRP